MQVKNISKKFKNKVILNNINMKISHAGLYVISGISGVGKTTLLNIISGLDSDFSGTLYDVESISYSRQELSLFEGLTLRENISLSNNFQDQNIELLQKFRIEKLLDQKVKSLSGGQKARCELYKSYVSNESIILIDEPTANLDEESSFEILELIKILSFERIVIVASHDENILKNADYLYSLKDTELECIKDKHSDNILRRKEVDRENKKISQIIRLIFKNDIKKYISEWIIISIFVIVFTLINLSVYSLLSSFYQESIGAYSNDAIVASINEVTTEEVIQSDKLYFSKSDLEKMRNIEGVEKAYIFSNYLSMFSDENNNILELRDKNKKFEFRNLSTPVEALDIYNLFDIEIIGRNPVLGNNEIIIPSSMCDYLNSKCEELIDTFIEIPVNNENGEVIEKYFVTGYYNSEKDLSDVSYVYTPYRDELALTSPDEKILLYETFDRNPELYDPEIFNTFESWDAAFGTGFGSIIIESSPGKEKQVKESIKELWPYANVTSNSDLRGIITANRNNNLVMYLSLEFILFTILFSVYFVSSKSFTNTKRMTKVKLYLLHYKISDLNRIIIIENIVKNIVAFLPSVLILFLLDGVNYILIVAVLMFSIFSSWSMYLKDKKYLKRKNFIKVLNRK